MKDKVSYGPPHEDHGDDLRRVQESVDRAVAEQKVSASDGDPAVRILEAVSAGLRKLRPGEAALSPQLLKRLREAEEAHGSGASLDEVVSDLRFRIALATLLGVPVQGIPESRNEGFEWLLGPTIPFGEWTAEEMPTVPVNGQDVRTWTPIEEVIFRVATGSLGLIMGHYRSLVYEAVGREIWCRTIAAQEIKTVFAPSDYDPAVYDLDWLFLPWSEEAFRIAAWQFALRSATFDGMCMKAQIQEQF